MGRVDTTLVGLFHLCMVDFFNDPYLIWVVSASVLRLVSSVFCVESVHRSRTLLGYTAPAGPGVTRVDEHHARVCVGVRVRAGGSGGLELPNHLLLHLQDDQLQEHRLPAGGGQY